MKIFAPLLLLLICSLNCLGQSLEGNYKQGWKFIHKAQKKLKHGNLSKSEKYINKAKKCDYGFCGNAWASAFSSIDLTEVQILNRQKKYDESLTILDSLSGCSFGADCETRDSLKIVTLFLKFGEEKVKNAFKKVTQLNTPNDFFSSSDFWVFLPDLNYKFLFDGESSYTCINGKRITYVNGQIVEIPKTDHDFYDLAKNRPFYKLLQ